MSVLVYLETTDAGVRSASLAAVTAARSLAQHRPGPLVGVLIGAGVHAAASDAARYVDKVLVYDHPSLQTPLAETFAPVLAAALQTTGADALVACATSTGKDVLPRTAALIGAGLASEVMTIESGNQFKRPTYAGNALTTVEVSSPVVLVTVRQTSFEPAQPAANVGSIEAAQAGSIDAKGAEFVALQASKNERPDLAEAQVVVAGGRGMKSGENFRVLEQLTDLLGGALGASRAAADAGMVPNDLQVGQTGKVVAPKLYIAVGISGAIQHLAGMKNSKTIVAINKDADAPIFQVADYGLVADWEKAVPELMAEIKKLGLSK